MRKLPAGAMTARTPAYRGQRRGSPHHLTPSAGGAKSTSSPEIHGRGLYRGLRRGRIQQCAAVCHSRPLNDVGSQSYPSPLYATILSIYFVLQKTRTILLSRVGGPAQTPCSRQCLSCCVAY